MSTTLTTASRTQLQSTSDAAGYLETLLLEHASWLEPVRLANDTRSWTIAGQAFTALPVKIKLPNSAQGETPRARLQIDNVGLELTAALEALPVGSTIMATLQLRSRARPTEVSYQFISPLASISVTPTAITADMGDDETMRQSAVRVRFDPETAPGLFAG